MGWFRLGALGLKRLWNLVAIVSTKAKWNTLPMTDIATAGDNRNVVTTFSLMLSSAAYSGFQEIVEPSRDNFNTAPVEPKSLGDLQNHTD